MTELYIYQICNIYLLFIIYLFIIR